MKDRILEPNSHPDSLADLNRLLRDMTCYQRATLTEIMADHYTVERIYECLVVTAVRILLPLLAEKDAVPTSYREAFETAGKAGLLPQDLAQRLAQAAGMRNILVHRYEEIDYQILHQSIQPALNDFAQFALVFTPSAN